MNIQPAIAPLRTGANEKIAPKTETQARPTEDAPVQPSLQETFVVQSEGESRNSAAFRAGIRKGVDWGQKVERPLGGAAAIATAIAGGAALSFGGAVVGAMVGGGFAPVIGSLTSNGVMDFMAKSFSAVGTAAQIGSTAGAVMGLAGGAVIGSNIGGSIAQTAAFPFGFTAGYAQGLSDPSSVPPPAAKEPSEPGHRSELRGAFRAQGRVLSGAGVLSGAVGGFVGGAALTTAGSLIADMASGDFTFSNFISNVPSSALIGGAIGGVALGAVGGYGGEGIARASQWGYDKTLGKAMAGKPGLKERLEKREGSLNERQGTLELRSENLAEQTASYRAQHQEASQGLLQREDAMGQDEKSISGELSTVQTRIEENANNDFRQRAASSDPALDASGAHSIIGERSSLDSWDEKLQGWNRELDTFQGTLNEWEGRLDQTIDKEAGAIFSEERKPIDSHFAGLHKELDAFETKMDQYEESILSRIEARFDQRVGSEKPGLERDLANAKKEKATAERDRNEALRSRDSAASRLSSAESSRDSARSRLRRAESETSTLSSRVASLNSRVSQLQSQLNSCRSSL